MDFESFRELFEGALEYITAVGDFLTSFWSVFPGEVQTFLFAIFVIAFGFATILKVISIMK